MTSGPTLGRAGTRAREEIFRLIETGVFSPGQKLPGERDLAEQIAVSRAVLREALAFLEHEGKVRSSPWRGWYVTTPHMAERVTLQSFSEMARARGLVPGAKVRQRTTRSATLQEAGALGIAPTSRVHEVHRLRTLDGVSACYDVTVIALDRAPGIEHADLADASLYQALEDVCGVRVVRTDYRMRAEAATKTIAQALDVEHGAPVLVGEEVAADIAGHQVLLGHVTYRQEAYEFHATLWRSYESGPR
ncbi:MAG: GntR family transcriptional regulator [Beutenbergiaceae bacterium]